MRDLLNPHFSQFSDRVTRAAEDGSLRAGVLVEALDQANRAAIGVEVVLRMIEANDMCKANDGENAPLSDFQTGALTGLAIFGMQSLVAEIERVSEWADKHGIREESHVE